MIHRHPTRQPTRRSALAAFAVAAVLCAPLPGVAQTFPDHQVKLVVGFPPGSGPDLVARHHGGATPGGAAGGAHLHRGRPPEG
ncbi:hypothetical protein [Sphaerotilus microaerophilus]|uniref:Tripartite tricarboxylate transporter family receptor n=1 Tax=Sphaerotilus microaerophilus TaxID=2914710 RepID=A0ABN6PJV8_9BURK|nr:hypothetical protein [Sphaerotilus sp. FB-5]BDI04128.1 hypothetical protein CATMQ487_10980 [Sphaerotilus sp. FB-5]